MPAMTVQDLDWMGGSRLIEYRVEGDGQEAGTNLRVPVELTIQDKDGKRIKKKVKYTIGTSPMLTVFREIF